MTAISTGVARPNLDTNSHLGACKAKASTSIPQGAVVAVESGTGYALNGATALTHIVLGVATKDCDNSAGSNGDKTVEYERGVFAFDNSAGGDEVTQADYGKPVYLVDNNTVAKTSGLTTAAGTRSFAGICRGLHGTKVLVEMSEAISLALRAVLALGGGGVLSNLQIATGTIANGVCTINTGIVVTANTYGFAIPLAVITGSTNVGTIAFINASKTAGAAGTGAVVFNVLGDDGAVDADAAGTLVALLLN